MNSRSLRRNKNESLRSFKKSHLDQYQPGMHGVMILKSLSGELTDLCSSVK